MNFYYLICTQIRTLAFQICFENLAFKFRLISSPQLLMVASRDFKPTTTYFVLIAMFLGVIWAMETKKRTHGLPRCLSSIKMPLTSGGKTMLKIPSSQIGSQNHHYFFSVLEQSFHIWGIIGDLMDTIICDPT